MSPYQNSISIICFKPYWAVMSKRKEEEAVTVEVVEVLLVATAPAFPTRTPQI
jgi:hypothetical protein